MREPSQQWMDLVLAVDSAWGIGRNNALPWPKLSEDLRHFQRLTSAAQPGKRNAVIMGRRTWESKEVSARPLPRRLNVVLTRGSLRPAADVLVVDSLQQALAQLASHDDVDNVFVIGGAEIYVLALQHPRCRAIYLTRIDGNFDCDTRVPDLDGLCEVDTGWPASDHHQHGVRFRIEKLRLKQQPRTE
jgi:dihydrofolate reductase